MEYQNLAEPVRSGQALIDPVNRGQLFQLLPDASSCCTPVPDVAGCFSPLLHISFQMCKREEQLATSVLDVPPRTIPDVAKCFTLLRTAHPCRCFQMLPHGPALTDVHLFP